MDFYQAVVGGKRFTLDLEAIASEGKIAEGEFAGLVGVEGTVKLEGVAGEFDGGFEREAVRAGDFEAELSGVALRFARKGERESEKENAEVEQ